MGVRLDPADEYTHALGPEPNFNESMYVNLFDPGTRGGFAWEDGVLHLCDHVELATEYEGHDNHHRRVRGCLRSRRSDRAWDFTGEVLNLIPLRNRRLDPTTGDGAEDGRWLVTRISEGMTRWTMSDGRVGYGLSEYLDQMVNGQPVGRAE